jgi:outer membrane protein OmpA-like peptidoglycan-associated protein
MNALATFCTALVVFSVGHLAGADGLNLNRYSASETVEDGFHISRPADQGSLRFGISLHLDYANDPLVLELEQGSRNSEAASVVEHQLTSHLNFSLGLAKRIVLFTGFQTNLLLKGEDYADPGTGQVVNTADGPGIGDVHLGLRGRLVGDPEDIVALSLQARVIFPTGNAANSDQLYSGESLPSFIPEILFEIRPGPVAITFNLGTQVRKDVSLGTVAARDDFLYGLGFMVPLVKQHLDAHLELFGSTPFKGFGDREATNLEGLLGLKSYFGKKWSIGAAGGMGFTRGIGSPDFRTVFMIGYVMPEKEEAPPEPVQPVEKDTDGDGLLDSQDMCPDEPEDRDGFEDADGCPDPDNDKDGVLDVNDGCPNDPEDADAFEDEDGCPDPDNDKDGIPDASDECPNDPEDPDGFEDEDGCPDPDNDEDGVLDVDDECPLAPGIPEEKGCPKTVRLDFDAGRIEILQRVEFATGKDVILKRSEPVLKEVYDILRVNKNIKRIRIEGHTDNRGKDKANLDLSKRRARSVKLWLINQGIDAERFEAFGCGENLPLESNRSRSGRQKNRRVEFHIVDPAPASGARSTGDQCEELE